MAYKIEADKKKHFWVGIPLGILLQFGGCFILPLHPLLATIASLAMLVTGCYGFELFSLVTGKGHADHLDAVAGIIGGLIGMCIYWLVYMLIAT